MKAAGIKQSFLDSANHHVYIPFDEASSIDMKDTQGKTKLFMQIYAKAKPYLSQIPRRILPIFLLLSMSILTGWLASLNTLLHV